MVRRFKNHQKNRCFFETAVQNRFLSCLSSRVSPVLRRFLQIPVVHTDPERLMANHLERGLHMLFIRLGQEHGKEDIQDIGGGRKGGDHL